MKQKRVGLLMEPAPSLLVALVSILRFGACVVPLSSNMPIKRLRHIITDADIDLIISDSINVELSEALVTSDRTINFGEIAWDLVSPDYKCFISPEYYCYIIYTSGSTGDPKGVPISHKNLSPVLFWGMDYLGLTSGAKVLHNLSYVFDFGLFEIFTTLMSCGELHFLPDADFDSIVEYIRKRRIDVLHATPSFVTHLLSSQGRMDSLRILHLGGEAVSSGLLSMIRACTSSNIQIYNGYGPTECSINSSIYKVPSAHNSNLKVPIGKPTANNRIYILDEGEMLVPIGVAGEIFIAGSGLSEGYINQPQLTSQKFVKDAFFPGEKMYKTGDIGKWLHDGNIEFLGRLDSMVKINGYRVDLGEIESAILKLEYIKGAAVTMIGDHSGTEIVAYLISESQVVPERLRVSLSGILPYYMLPMYLVQLEKFPLTISGKTDYKKLPLPDRLNRKMSAPFVAPRNKTEFSVLEIWKAVLMKEEIGVLDNFFELGGHSLSAIKVITKLIQVFHIKVHLNDFFATPTVEAIAEHIANSKWAVSKPGTGQVTKIVRI